MVLGQPSSCECVICGEMMAPCETRVRSPAAQEQKESFLPLENPDGSGSLTSLIGHQVVVD